MIEISEIEISGRAEAGQFIGRFQFGPGLQVISAHNSFGKSLAARAIAWCLGAEAVYGRPDNDATLFPLAVREEIELEGPAKSRVIASECAIVLRRHDGAAVRIERDISGEPARVRLIETKPNEPERRSELNARFHALTDEIGGLQAFLFDWLGWPHKQVTTYKGTEAGVYIENLLPLFYIEQHHGWTDIQANQVGRYGQQQIAETAVEFLLGAGDAVDARFHRNRAAITDARLREGAKQIAARIAATLARHGWAIDWSPLGTTQSIESRWSARSIRATLLSQAKVDLAREMQTLQQQSEAQRKRLTSGELDPANVTAPAGASQRAIELKRQRHDLNEELRSLRAQRDQARELLESIEHRLQAAQDVHRYKTVGIGRFSDLECPTCHRHLDPQSFDLMVQSVDVVAAHIEALKRDRELIRRNLEALESAIDQQRGRAEEVDEQLRLAQRALVTVNEAVGTLREQIAEVANALTATERKIDRLVATSKEIDELQQAVDAWLQESRTARQTAMASADLLWRLAEFTGALRGYVVALGHSAVTPDAVHTLDLSDRYEPYLGNRRLLLLGSASDVSRLVAAYTLALAAASVKINGWHPGFAVLDEPLQQNPDAPHKRLFLEFVGTQLLQQSQFQTIIFTYLLENEVIELRQRGVNVITPAGEHFLKVVPPKPEPTPTEGEPSTT